VLFENAGKIIGIEMARFIDDSFLNFRIFSEHEFNQLNYIVSEKTTTWNEASEIC
jgi:hypothetical protein